MEKTRLKGILEALTVTLLWSSSYILTKFGLNQITPLNLVTYRYITATIVLFSISILRGELKTIDSKTLLKLGFLGITGYSIAQGLQVLGLFYLPAITVTFILNFTPITVLILELVLFREKPTPRQLTGVFLVISGAYLFFQGKISTNNILGIIITLISGLGWASFLIYSKKVNIKEQLTPLGLTTFTMGIGTAFITGGTLVFEGLNPVPFTGLIVILWLGVVNTAVAFFLWNQALKKLEAFEIAILQNTMLIQITLLSWIFLGEQLTPNKLISMTLVFTGVLIVQLRK